jgi:hypothetical protein
MAAAVLLAVLAAAPFAFFWGQQPQDQEPAELQSPHVGRLVEWKNPESTEIEDQIRDLRTGTEALEANLNCRNTSESADQIGAEIQRVLQATSMLEQEIQSGATGAPPFLSNNPYYGR